MKKIVLFLSLIFCLFAANPANAAISSIMIDANSGKVLYSKNADLQRYPASLTKVMTLYITFDALEKGLIKTSDMLTVSRTAANRSPSKLGLKAGEKISVEDAIMAIIIKSANDCATVLAEGLGYSEENFAKTMTKVAQELGMNDTVFKNASGLPNRQQKTTARDMALLGAALYHHFPQYYPLFATKSFSYEGRTYYTHNRLLKTFEGTDGLKTGFTSASGYNIITSAERNGRRVIAVTMGHNTSGLRDRNVKKMMEDGLNKLALDDKTKNSKIYANLEESTKPKKIEEVKIASDSAPVLNKTAENSWGVQIGAYSNYTKARNNALDIKDEIESENAINVEAVSKKGAVIYRSQIIGFSKKDAEKTCKDLQSAKKQCIVVAVKNDSKIQLANIAATNNEQQP